MRGCSRMPWPCPNTPRHSQSSREATAWLLNEAGQYYWGNALIINRRAGLLERAVAIREARLGVDHPAPRPASTTSPTFCTPRATWTAPVRLHERALAIREASSGPEHPTPPIASRPRHVLRAQGDLTAAAHLFERALAIRETHLGPDHPDTANSLHNLASVLHAQGDLAGARTLHERALAIYRAQLGSDHPDTAGASTTSPRPARPGRPRGARPSTSAPWPSARPAWAPTTPTPPAASTTSPRPARPGRPGRRPHPTRAGPGHPRGPPGRRPPRHRQSLNNLATSCTPRATWPAPAACTSAPWPSARPAWAPTTPTPATASTTSPTSCTPRATWPGPAP